MKTYFTINPKFKIIAALQNPHKIRERVKKLAELEELPPVTFHPTANVRSMGDSGAGWVIIQHDGEDFAQGIDGQTELSHYQQFTLGEILKYQPVKK